MKTFLRILQFARPIEKYAIPYFFCVVLHALFNTLNFALIIPILTTLFDGESMKVVVTEFPDFVLSTTYLENMVKFGIYKVFGTSYTIHDVLLGLSAMVVSSVLLSNGFRFASQKIMENFRIHTLQNLRDSLFQNVMKLNIGFFSNEKKGDILSKLTSDINVVQFCVTNTLQVAFKEPALIIGYFIMLLSVSGKLTLFVLAILPLTAIVIGVIVKNLRKNATEAQESLGDMVSIAEEALSGVKLLNAYNAIDYIIGKFKDKDTHYSRILRRMATRQQMASPMSEFLGVAAVSGILIYGGGMVVNGEISPEAFIGYLGAFSQITRPARSVADSFSTIHQGLAAGERVLRLADTPSTICNSTQAQQHNVFKEKIVFKDVRFSYEDKEVLHGLSFEIKKGETVALVGGSGGGKSTIADLIPRFYDVTSGSIEIDGVNIKQIDLQSLREMLGIVSQDVILFNDTIAGNISLGETVSRAEIEKAAQIANAHSFIMECSNGYDTNIGDRGVKLSGGQRQRLSIARAVLRNPQILILDEATSALDTESEKLVQDALTNLLKDRTSLVIAHRLSTIQHANKIIVVDAGKIVEQGNHNQLIALNGFYKKLIDLQQV